MTQPLPLDSQPPAVLRDASAGQRPGPRRPWPLRVYARWLHEASFRRHLSVAVALGALCLALLMAAVNAWQGGRQVRAMLMEQGGRIAANLAANSSLALLYAAADNAEEAVRSTLAFPDVMGIEIRDTSGRLLLALGPGGDKLPAAAARGRAASEPWLDLETEDSWAFAAPVWTRPEPSPFDVTLQPAQQLGQVRIILSKATLHRTQASLFIANFGMALLFAALFLFLVRFLALRLTRPLAALSQAMEKVEAGDSDARAPAGGPRDIAAMADTFNRMLAVLQEREAELGAHRDHLEELVRARTLELIEAKERAEVASRAKSQFLARMSHELRTPLNAVMGYAQILKMDEAVTAKQRNGLDIIHSSGQHLLTLIVDILDLSRIEAGKGELRIVPVDLVTRLNAVADIVRVMAVDKQITLAVELDPRLPPVVLADEKRLSQILLNLLGNAVKFTQLGGVTLRALALPSAETLAGHVLLRFEVEDSGVGIAEDQVERLFEPFEQAGSADQRVAGTGLGLAISRQLVRMMGGEIRLETRLGEGSRFWFEISVPVPTALS
ncbi:signal transduction histidine kinase [Pelomonas aquatica]|uniref:histidine kinase n=1 Tax=Pelomonas aquatica TaxID=431058 RepID=A0ABU1Z3B4_9BURK|nr:ATP-binding protein [Pelomonas aquatica]MDR7295104.1 signal transduction histidine kinase [Pelomonas aquatica]